MSKQIAKDKKEIKRFEDFKQSKPLQLTLFEMVLPEDKDYSNTIEFYDFIPKYVCGKVKRIDGEFLRELEREFICKGNKYTVTIFPAKIKESNGKSRDYFPSRREELVEDALRKIAVEGQSLYLDELASVSFNKN